MKKKKKKKKFIIIGIILAIPVILMIRLGLAIKEEGSFFEVDKDHFYDEAVICISRGVEVNEIVGISEKHFSTGKEDIENGIRILSIDDFKEETQKKAVKLKVLAEGYIESVENFLDSRSKADEQDVEMYSKEIRDITHEIYEKENEKLKKEKNRL